MTITEAVRRVLEDYPKIFFACHRRHVRDPKAGSVISAHQASILDHLDEVQPMSLNALAAHMGVTASTMSLNIDRLVAAGYVLRRRDRADGRRVGLRLTAAGGRVKGQRKVLDDGQLRGVLRRLPEADRTRAIEGLALLAAAAAEHMSQSKHGRWWGRSRDGAHTAAAKRE